MAPYMQIPMERFRFLLAFLSFLKRFFTAVCNYLRKLEFLCDNQLGFRKNHSTSLALTDLSLYRSGHVLPCSFKAFDTIDYNILLDNLNTLVYEAQLWTGLEATSPTGCISFNLTVNIPLHKFSAMMSFRDPFCVIWFSCATLMI